MFARVAPIIASDSADIHVQARAGARQAYRWLRLGLILCAIAIVTVFAGHLHAAPTTSTSIPSSGVVATAGIPAGATTPAGVQGGRAIPPVPTPAAMAPTGQPAGFGGAGDWWDPSTWIPDALGAAFKWLYHGIVDPLDQFIQWIFSLNIITTTDPQNSYHAGAVITAWPVIETVAMSLLGIVVVWIGFQVMSAGGLGTQYRTAREMLPRVVLTGLAIHFSLYFASFLIDFNDALCKLSYDPANPNSPLHYLVSAWSPGNPDLMKGIFTIIFAVVAFLLLIQEFCRLALIDVLLVTAPFGFLCLLTPETQGWARLWSSTFVSVVLVQAVQLLVLVLGGSFIHLAGITAPDGLTGLLIGLATLYTAFKVPTIFRSLGGGQAGNILNDMAGVAGDVVVAARFAALFA
jgi:hypothetical protein